MRRVDTAIRLALRATGLAVLILGAPALARVQDTAVTPQAADALRHFLNLDCAIGEEGAALEQVLLHAEQLEPEFRRLLLDGPDPSTLDDVRASVEAEWDRREAFLSTNPQLGLRPDELLAVHAVQREEYLQRGVARFEKLCRERAVMGLAAIGSPTAHQTLREQANLVDDALRDLIRAALGPGKTSPEKRHREQRLGSDPRE